MHCVVCCRSPIHHRYNAKNGGPCDQCDDFWTSSSAYDAFQDYARAVVARWGASTSVFAWQMWNEMDGAIGGTSDAAGWWLGNITTFVFAFYFVRIEHSLAE